MPVMFWNRMPPRCDGLPGPAVPDDALSGLAFSQAMRPLRSFAGRSFFAQISQGVPAMNATGSKSVSTSYWSGYTAPLMTCVTKAA